MKYLLCLLLLALSACNNKSVEDDHYAMITTSMMGGTVNIANFNGNSSTKKEDCELVSKMLSDKFERTYTCIKLKDLKISE